ncbi:hypothetical protein UlMin_000504 [Ulmus minor]
MYLFMPFYLFSFERQHDQTLLMFLQVTQFVNGLFESRNDLSTFKNHIRDFHVQAKEFFAQEATAQKERE